jgi:hypothetical protein
MHMPNFLDTPSHSTPQVIYDTSSISKSQTQITTGTDWKLRGNAKLQRPKRPQRPQVAGVALWHAPSGNVSNYVARHAAIP